MRAAMLRRRTPHCRSLSATHDLLPRGWPGPAPGVVGGVGAGFHRAEHAASRSSTSASNCASAVRSFPVPCQIRR